MFCSAVIDRFLPHVHSSVIRLFIHRLEKWKSNIRMKPATRTRQFLCSDHFGLEAFTNTLRRRLLPGAAPSIQVAGGIPDKTTCNVIKIESIEM